MKDKLTPEAKISEREIIDRINDEIINQLLSEYTLMESPVIYFSAGDAKIKEILIRKDPFFSA